MKNKFTLGAIAGITTVVLAVPMLAQMSSAATATTTGGTASSPAAWPSFTRPVPTQQQVKDRAAEDGAFLQNIDAMIAIQKSATQAHEAALTAAASIADDTQRQAAVQKADDDRRTTIQNAIAANPALQSAMPFGERGFGGRGGPGHGRNPAELAAKLGMTQAELKAALDGGKTIQQIAQEKGVTLPMPHRGGFGRMHDNDADDANVSSGSATQGASTASAQ